MLAFKLLPHLLYPTTWVLLLIFSAMVLTVLKRPRGAVAAMLAAAMTLGLFASPLVSSGIWSALERRYPPQPVETIEPGDAIALLGGGVELPAPPRLMPDLNDAADRLWFAAKLYHAGKAPVIIVSGGQVFPQHNLKSEADYHVELLMQLGVPREAILLETRARNTEENALFIADIMRERDWHRVLLTTSAAHMPRAVVLFERMGLETIPAVCDVRDAALEQPGVLSLLPDADALAASEIAIREWLGLWFYQLKPFFSR
jgi:uncharacterized SAM-binding protein YcdF (DUF218 family)